MESGKKTHDLPTSVQLDLQTGVFEPCAMHVTRKVSDLSMMFYDTESVEKLVKKGDPVVYDIRHQNFITRNSDMALGVTVVQPGKVGDEYHMTKGHFHEREDRPEIYFCVQGEGYLLMETNNGDFKVEFWRPGTITHIPGNYAHRVVNTGDKPLYFFASFNVSAGHLYKPVIENGFSKIVVEREGETVIIANPRRK